MAVQSRAVKGPNMEGFLARWYARNTRAAMDAFRREAAEIAARLSDGAAVLEIAPGPGYLAVELAKFRRFSVTVVDYSHTFVEICRENARDAGVLLTCLQGDAAHLPCTTGTFDLVVCRAAFKNFGDPQGALEEMHRVLRPGGVAVIDDMRKNVTGADIASEVRDMKMGWMSGILTRSVLRGLRKRAYTREAFQTMIAGVPFADSRIDTKRIAYEIELTK